LESITDRLAPGVSRQDVTINLECEPTGGIKASDNAAFGPEPQGYGMANRLAYGPVTADWASFSCKRF
jgi:hypothetical protein